MPIKLKNLYCYFASLYAKILFVVIISTLWPLIDKIAAKQAIVILLPSPVKICNNIFFISGLNKKQKRAIIWVYLNRYLVV